MIPEDLRYSSTHEWVRMDDGLATVGITDHAQSELGDVVLLELPKVGTLVQKGDVFGTIESVKTVSDLLSPVSGEIVEINEELPETPELVNEEPYTSAWIAIIKMDHAGELDELLTADQYESYIQEQ